MWLWQLVIHSDGDGGHRGWQGGRWGADMVADELSTWWWTWRLPRDRQGQTTWQAYLELGQFCNFCNVWLFQTMELTQRATAWIHLFGLHTCLLHISLVINRAAISCPDNPIYLANATHMQIIWISGTVTDHMNNLLFIYNEWMAKGNTHIWKRYDARVAQMIFSNPDIRDSDVLW